jgi:hypothetical protein
MDIVSYEQFKELLETQHELCLSFFLPTHRSGPEIQQNPIHLKNLLKDAEEQLGHRGVRSLEIQEILSPIQKLIEETPFWQHQNDGLALFLAQDFFQSYRLPLHFDPLVVVASRFYITPLLPLQPENPHVYILALSQNAVKLFRGTQYGVSEIPLEGAPESLAEALRYDEPEKQLQVRSFGEKEDHSEVFHGHGAGQDDTNTHIFQYFRQVNTAVQTILRDEKAPLLIAAVEYLLPIYKEANTYPHLLPEGISGNPEEMNAEELRKKAWNLVEPIFMKARDEKIAQYKRVSHTEREKASHDLKEIVLAAYHGRVETLFVARGSQQWGQCEPDSQKVFEHETRKEADEDLLNIAAVQTILHGGTVYAVEPGQIPTKSLAAAIFRH